MECRQCGAEVVQRAAFCHECGTPQKQRQPRQKRRRIPHRRPQVDIEPKNRWNASQAKITNTSANDRETHLWSGTFSVKGMASVFLLAILVSVVLPLGAVIVRMESTYQNWIFALLGLGWFVLLGVLAYRKLDVHYELTNQRFIHKCGILRRTVNRIEVIDIDDVQFEQGILERMMGAGTIEVISSDESDPIFELPGIDNVYEVAQLFDDARRAERVRRGIHIESV